MVSRGILISLLRLPTIALSSHEMCSDCVLHQVLKEIQSKKEAEMVQQIIEKVKAECKAQGEDVDRRGYTKHYNNTN